jgi:hypothetical protein
MKYSYEAGIWRKWTKNGWKILKSLDKVPPSVIYLKQALFGDYWSYNDYAEIKWQDGNVITAKIIVVKKMEVAE